MEAENNATKLDSAEPARTVVARLPELVRRILRHVRSSQYASSFSSRTYRSRTRDSAAEALRALLRVNHLWAACTVEVIYADLKVWRPEQLEKLLDSLTWRRRRVNGVAIETGNIPRYQFLTWLSTPVVHTIDFSRFSWRTWHVDLDLRNNARLLDIREAENLRRDRVNSNLLSLATELAIGHLLKGQVSEIVFPDYVASQPNEPFDETSVPPQQNADNLADYGDHYGHHRYLDFENSRFDCLSLETFLSLLDVPGTMRSTLRGSTDTDFSLLEYASVKGKFRTLTSLSLATNFAYANDPLTIEARNRLRLPRMFRDGNTPFRLEVTLDAGISFWTSLTRLTFLELLSPAVSSFVVILAARHCPNLKVLRTRLQSLRVPNSAINEHQNGLAEPAVKEAMFSSSSLEELKIQISHGNVGIVQNEPDLWLGTKGAKGPSSLKTLEIEYEMMYVRRLDDPDSVYDVEKSWVFLNDTFTRVKHLLTKLHLESFSSRLFDWDEVDFSCFTALEDVSLELAFAARIARVSLYGEKDGERARHEGYPGVTGSFCPGDQFAGSRNTLKSLTLGDTRVWRMVRFAPAKYANGELPTMRADEVPEFPKLESLTFSYVDFYKDPMLLWLGRCPALNILRIVRPFRLPESCSFLGPQVVEWIQMGDDHKFPTRIDPDLSSKEQLQLAFPAKLSIAAFGLNSKLVRCLEPQLLRVVALTLIGRAGRRINNRAPDEILSKTGHLEALEFHMCGLDSGALKVIAKRATERLRDIVIRDSRSNKAKNPHGQKLGITEPSHRRESFLRFNAVSGFLRAMVNEASKRPVVRQPWDADYVFVPRPHLRIRLGYSFWLLAGEDELAEQRAVITWPGRRGNLATSKERHQEAWLRERDAMCTVIDELGLESIYEGRKPSTADEREEERRQRAQQEQVELLMQQMQGLMGAGGGLPPVEQILADLNLLEGLDV